MLSPGAAATGATVTVVSDATLAGSGTVAGALAVEGVVAPAGTLTVTGAATFAAGAETRIGLRGTAAGQFDRLDIAGAVALGGALAVGVDYAFAAGDSFLVLSVGGTAPPAVGASTFNGLAEGAIVTVGTARFRLTYRGGDGHRLRAAAGAAA